MTDTTSRRPSRLVLGTAAGIALALGVPLAASAHVHVDAAGDVHAGATQTLTFSFSHGCDGSPTTALAIDIPEAAGNATPIAQGGWTITREAGADGTPTRIVYTAENPIDDGVKATVSLDVLFTEESAGTTVAFPATQTCAEGETAWVEIAEEGQDPHDLEAPAPVIAVGPVADAEDGHGHAGDAAETEDAHADAGVDATAADAVTTSATTEADPVARWLAAGGLVAGLAALVVALVRGRRKA